ncbi:hypothetical protein [Phenylobacterium sp.]|jgi:hypothetical protein|uniref:hypothetical protein n=1 Tax=Phenylobacterium sp. TaxID=1871053 RepID=UPI00120B2AEA|nr:hypothetical protein [Phenylobacterium sp.]THD70531.1 MAG: hypothetical protein E8A12_02940 [Phenylobacterium sp.]
MDIHKPKPWHGGREFAKEVGTIVLGVLIALAMEQAAEWAHWRQKLSDLRIAMTSELASDDAPQAYTRMAIGQCMDRQLDALQSAAEQGVSRVELAKLAKAYPASDETWDDEGWKGFLAADGPAHMSAVEANSWWFDYAQATKMDQIGDDERQAIGALRAIRPKAGPMSEPELQDLNRAVGRLRNDNRWMVHDAAVVLGDLTYLKGSAHVPLNEAAMRRRVAGAAKDYHLKDCVVAVELIPAGLKDTP